MTTKAEIVHSPQGDEVESKTTSILNLAAYKFVALDNLPTRRKELSQLASDLQLHGTILLSAEGINLFVAGKSEYAEQFLELLRSDECFADIAVKRSWTDYQPFRRMLVKIKREIIAFGIDSIHPEQKTAPKLQPEELKAWLDTGRRVTLLDTRNDYEVELGTFHGAVDLGIHHFRDFPQASQSLPEETRQQPLVMFCTGGIRCEKAGVFLEQSGFREVYQLDGGILNYFEKCGGSHYDGDCFVFDHRVAVTPDLKPSGAKLCFTCQATLTADDIALDQYQVGVSCPKCYTSMEEQQQEILFRRNQALKRLATSLPGSTPYENRHPLYVARQFAGMTVIDWLLAMQKNYTRGDWMKAIDAGQLVTGPQHSIASNPVAADSIIREGQCIVHIQPNYVEPTVNGDIRVLYEDRWIVVVDKPASLPSHASGKFCRNTLDYLLNQVYRPEKLLLAHRLDADTSGVMVLSRRNAVAGKLQQQFAEHTVQKSYLAQVHGHPSLDDFECDVPIGRTATLCGGRAIDHAGDQSLTQFRVRSRLDDGTSLIEVFPKTGRTHQIRLHFAHLGFPILFDPLYGSEGKAGINLDGRSSMLRLHALAIAFTHPHSGQSVKFESGFPGWIDSRIELTQSRHSNDEA